MSSAPVQSFQRLFLSLIILCCHERPKDSRRVKLFRSGTQKSSLSFNCVQREEEGEDKERRAVASGERLHLERENGEGLFRLPCMWAPPFFSSAPALASEAAFSSSPPFIVVVSPVARGPGSHENMISQRQTRGRRARKRRRLPRNY